MASPDDTIFWPPFEGTPTKKWPTGPLQKLDGPIPNTVENSTIYAAAQLAKAIEAEPERYTSDYKESDRMQRPLMLPYWKVVWLETMRSLGLARR